MPAQGTNPPQNASPIARSADHVQPEAVPYGLDVDFGELALAVAWGAAMALAFLAVKPRLSQKQMPWFVVAWMVVFVAVGAFLISG